MWHWLYFLPVARRSETGEDGHPARGGFLPPYRKEEGCSWEAPPSSIVPAGGRDRRAAGTVKSVVQKEGRSGPLVFVSVEYRVSGENGPALTETQNLVYTESSPSDPAEPPGQTGPPCKPWTQDVATDPVLLFGFSALTNNAHRIHYDHPYTTTVERYRGLVVHGPLIALLLAELARRNGVSEPGRFSFRARSPFLCGDTLCLRGRTRTPGTGRPVDPGSLLAAGQTGHGGGVLNLTAHHPRR